MSGRRVNHTAPITTALMEAIMEAMAMALLQNKGDLTMWTDFHLHVLPQIDDGASSIEMSIKMLEALSRQQVDSVFATPHFILHNTDIHTFVQARENAYQQLTGSPLFRPNLPAVQKAAEVAIEPDISKQDCLPLCYEHLSAILLELPSRGYKSWVLQEIENIRYGFKVLPVLAHLERYLWYEPEDIKELLKIPGLVVQINASAFGKREGRKLIKELYEQNAPVMVGTDSHNCGSRCPNLNIMEATIHKYRFKEWEPWLQKTKEWFLSQKRI